MKRVLPMIMMITLLMMLTSCNAIQEPRNGLYLYFPTTADSSFPDFYDWVDTSPLAAFNVADLDSGIGTTAQLRENIFDIVETDYYEFDVEVYMSTTSPNPSESRWQVVGIGSDAGTILGMGTLFGIAQDVDIGDADSQDYARVYADSFDEAYGDPGEALNGTDSTLDRWATAIGHTVSHEAGHNYGLAHDNADPATGSGEDQTSNHILATGGDLTGEIRASVNRHFSDISYEILGYNLGLNIKTVYNWDFTNPNSSDAHSLVITILSEASSLTLDWFYTGNRSPWTNPTVTSTGDKQEFQEIEYNIYELTFSTATSWCCGSDGVAPPGQEFHIGASFQESEPIVVYETTLKGSGGNDLPLHPRTISFDNGSADLTTGDFDLMIFNSNPGEGNLIIQNMGFVFLPRLLHINSMVADAERLEDYRGIEVRPYLPEGIHLPRYQKILMDQMSLYKIEISDQTSITLANLADPRHVDITYDATGCERGFNPPSDVESGEIEYCPEGTALSLFPATAVYVVAKVVDPNAEYFDPAVDEIVTGPLESMVFYQFTGFIPDFNNNGIDDLLDIREETSTDENNNGVPDEAEVEPSPWGWLLELPLWLIILLLLLLLLILILLFLRRRRP